MVKDHQQTIKKTGVLITYVDPAIRLVQAQTKQATKITIPITNVPAFFRWPVAGEKWVVHQENSNWILDSLWTDTSSSESDIETVNPGDVVIDSPTGEGYLGAQRIVTISQSTPIVTGSKSGGEALISLLAILVNEGLIVDNTTS